MAQGKSSQGTSVAAFAVAGLFIIILVAGLSYHFMYDKAQTKKQGLLIELDSAQTALETLEDQQRDYKKYRDEKDRLDIRLKDLQTKLPSSDEELDNFLKGISNRARSSRISKWSLFKQEDRIPKGEVDVIPIRMEFESSYEAAVQFFWDLASMGDSMGSGNRDQLVNITEVSMSLEGNSNKDDLSTTMVKVLCVAETYLYREDADKPEQGAN